MNFKSWNDELCLFEVSCCEIIDYHIWIKDNFFEKIDFFCLSIYTTYLDDFAHSSRNLEFTVCYGSPNNTIQIVWVLLVVSKASNQMLSEKCVKTGDKEFYGLVLWKNFDDGFLFFSHKL